MRSASYRVRAAVAGRRIGMVDLQDGVAAERVQRAEAFGARCPVVIEGEAEDPGLCKRGPRFADEADEEEDDQRQDQRREHG